jgi:hypothetical protein
LTVWGGCRRGRRSGATSTENASQRGTTAVAGTVASSLRFLAKALLGRRMSQHLLRYPPKGLEILRGQIASEKGLGQYAIARFLAGVPGVDDGITAGITALSKGEWLEIGRYLGKIERSTMWQIGDWWRSLSTATATRSHPGDRECRGASPGSPDQPGLNLVLDGLGRSRDHSLLSGRSTWLTASTM